MVNSRKKKRKDCHLYTPVCHSVHSGVAEPPLPKEQTPPRNRSRLPRSRHPSGVDTPWEQNLHPLRADTPLAQCMLGDTGNKRAVGILLECILVTGCNEVVAKVIFLHLSVILFTGGCLPQCMLGYHTFPGQTPPRGRHSPRADTPGSRPPQEQTPLEQTPPWSRPPWTRHTPGTKYTPRLSTPPGTKYTPQD